MQLIIDLESENSEEVENNIDNINDILREVSRLVSEGYTSGIDPSWSIEDENNPDTMYWLKTMRNQMRSSYHLSDSDIQRCVEAVKEIEAVRDEMLKKYKKVEA